MRRLFTWPFIYLYSIVILIASVVPISSPEELEFAFQDKIIHATLYALMAFLLINTTLKKKQTHPYCITVVYSLFLGLLIECIQYYLPYRAFETGDLLANAAGVGLGILFKVKHSAS